MDVKLIDRIRSHAESNFKQGATARQIAAAMQKSGVTFPPSYRAFLSHFDGGEFRFGRMYRITSKGAGFFDLFEQLARASEYYAPFEERTLFPIGDDYSGNYYCLDLAKQADEPAIVLVGRLLLGETPPRKVAKSLTEFIAKSLGKA